MSVKERATVLEQDDDGLPSLAEVRAIYAGSRNGPPPPWLSPEAIAAAAKVAASGVPELNGPIELTDLPDDE